MKYRYLLLLWLLCCSLSVPVSRAQNDMCTDPCLKAAVASLFIRSPFLSPFRVDISVHDGIATLQGTVSNADERELAEGTASAVDGITSVANDIKVDPAIQAQRTAESPLDCRTSDNALADRVKTQLYWHRATHGMRLEVTAQNGVITLDGKDTDPRQARLARLIALNTCGVRQVKSRIMTESRPWPA